MGLYEDFLVHQLDYNQIILMNVNKIIVLWHQFSFFKLIYLYIQHLNIALNNVQMLSMPVQF